ncbi:MAG: YebC/PmpR family DNA-binding transcriptional regulator [Candidatus Binatia bacterium]
MSGHSKWSSIKHKKAAKDAKRGKLFTKLIKEITVAARFGGGDLDSNPRLRTAVLSARSNSMPADNIERAIKKGLGRTEGADYQDIVYEGYGPGGMAVMVEALTDNKNRTVADLRHLFSKHGGNLGENGCVAWMFDRVGQVRVSAEQSVAEDRLFEIAVEAGATDVREDEDVFVLTAEVEDLETLRNAVAGAGVAIDGAGVFLEPKDFVRLAGKDAERAIKLLEALDDHDDVQRVSANFDIDEEELARLSA